VPARPNRLPRRHPLGGAAAHPTGASRPPPVPVRHVWVVVCVHVRLDPSPAAGPPSGDLHPLRGAAAAGASHGGGGGSAGGSSGRCTGGVVVSVGQR